MSEAASCCAAFYEKDWVAEMMGPSLHPGGLEGSRRLATSLNLGPSDRVLDVASGSGATARMIAEEFGCQVLGVDLSEVNVTRAASKVANLPVEFQVADATKLPFDDDSFDAIVCECAVSTFEDKAAVASEFARVLKTGGQLGVSDMCRYAELSPRLSDSIGPWACLQDALTVEGYQKLMLEAGLRATGYEDESSTLVDMALDFKRKLVVVGLGQMAGALDELGLDMSSARSLLDEARDEVKAGRIQYCRLTFSLGQPRQVASPTTAVETSGCDPSTGCC